MIIFAAILLFSFAAFFVFGMSAFFSFLLEVVFEDSVFGDICCNVTRFCVAAMILSGVIAIISGCISLISYVLSQ